MFLITKEKVSPFENFRKYLKEDLKRTNTEKTLAKLSNNFAVRTNSNFEIIKNIVSSHAN